MYPFIVSQLNVAAILIVPVYSKASIPEKQFFGRIDFNRFIFTVQKPL